MHHEEQMWHRDIKTYIMMPLVAVPTVSCCHMISCTVLLAGLKKAG